MQDIPTVAAAADACNYDSDNAKIMFQSRTHNLEFQLIGEKSENSNIYVAKFIYSKKATKFCEISTLLLTGTTWDKSKV